MALVMCEWHEPGLVQQWHHLPHMGLLAHEHPPHKNAKRNPRLACLQIEAARIPPVQPAWPGISQRSCTDVEVEALGAASLSTY